MNLAQRLQQHFNLNPDKTVLVIQHAGQPDQPVNYTEFLSGAAAYAEASQFGKAMSTEKEAIALTQDDDLRNEYQSRLKLYQAKAPFRIPDPLPRAPQLE